MDTSKIIRAVVGHGRYTTTEPIMKEDHGIILKIEGLELPASYEVDFSNSRKGGDSVTMIGDEDGVLIPTQFIKDGKDVFAFLYHVGADYGKTVYTFCIPNHVRPDRTNEQPEPEQQSVIDQAIAALNTAVAQTAQDVVDADASAQSASASATSAAQSVASAAESAQGTEEYATRAEAAQTAAESAQTAAETAAATATTKASQASSAESAAASAAQTATAKAIEAAQIVEGVEGYAESAAASASQAQASAQTASNKASEASALVLTATEKATEATTAAGTATTAKNDAVSAKTAAQTAQAAAETAQEAAEDAAESVSASAAQIATNTADISDLKSGLSKMTTATSEDVSKALKAKTVADGKVTEWEFGEAGGSVETDTTLTESGVPADAKAVGDAISAVGATVGSFDGRLQELSDTLYEYTSVPVNQTRNNLKLEDSGLYSTTTAYKAVMFPVAEGQILKVVSPYKFQFQTVNTAPSSGDSIRVGDTTYGDGTFKVTVPTGAKYVAVSVLKADTPTVSIVSNKFEAQTERLLSDEEIVLLLESAKDDIREINLSADFFQSGYSSRRTQLKVFNPTTLKGLFPTTPSADIYDNIDIGLRTLYLTKGDKVITNIDAVYDNSKLRLPNQAFANSGYYGVILSTFQNNSNIDNGSVYFGREAFDGKWRVLDIEVTSYYELSFRQDVSYTNKAYIWHQHKTLVDHNDIIADITDSLSFKDGCVKYNASTGWSGTPVDNIGSSGSYENKTVLLPDLTDYVGKSVLVTCLYPRQPEPTAQNTGWPAVIYYQNGEPTTYYLTYYRYIYNKDYACFPILDGYDMRIQFPSKACLPFVRVWIVDNDTLFKNGFANPVFYGKTILGFGDSYIAGQGIATTWHRMIAYRNSGHWINHGYGGAGLCYGGNGSLLNHLSDLDEDADIYILCFGRNDNSTNIQIGENDDELDTSVEWTPAYLINHATFKGAMNYLFNYLETRHPYAKILTVTPWGFVNNDNVTSGLSCLDYIDAMQEMSKKWGITCFNAAGDAGIHVRIEAYRTRYFLAYNDQSHLNADGHALMAKRATKLLTNLLYDD